MPIGHSKYGGAGGDGYGTGPSPIVWNKIPVLEIMANPNKGWGYFDQCIVGPTVSTGGTTLPPYIVSQVGAAGDIEDAALEGGVLAIEPPGTENQGMQFQTCSAFVADTDTMLAFGVRVKFTDVLQQDFYAGLAIADTDIAQTLPADVIGFNIADASANILYCVNTTSTVTPVDTGEDATADTFVRLEAIVTHEKSVKFYVDGVLTNTVTASIPTDTAMAMSVAQVTGEGVANFAYLDWHYAYQWSEIGK